uniref:(northern house mosquito) hypothetical protein n=1 Tax=Culex pipiens TaxID=7175 RepID=A0A8D8DSQ6_CULPI
MPEILVWFRFSSCNYVQRAVQGVGISYVFLRFTIFTRLFNIHLEGFNNFVRFASKIVRTISILFAFCRLTFLIGFFIFDQMSLEIIFRFASLAGLMFNQHFVIRFFDC